MLYDRKIKYVHLYEEDNKRQSVGFVKLERRENTVNLGIHISGLHCANQEEYVFWAKGNNEEAVLGKIYLENGRGSLEVKGLTTAKIAEGISYEELQEIFLKISVDMTLRCIIQEVVTEVPEERDRESHVEEMPEGRTEAELLQEAFVEEKRLLEENVPETVVVQEEVHEEEDEEIGEEEAVLVKARPQTLQGNDAEVPMSMAADKWQQLWTLYPHMKPFEDEREYLVMRPQDFVILQKQYYPLSANSFLLHGYYNYEHLILCRVTKREKDAFYIGVPGNFYEKEKQVAVLFGFESFEGKLEPAGNGDFGYYMMPVEI